MLDTLDLARADFEKQLTRIGWTIVKKPNNEYANPTIEWMWTSYKLGFIFAADNGYKSSVDKSQV